MKKAIILIGFCMFGLVATFIFNFVMLEKMIIPNPCYHHSQGTNKVFDLFYELLSAEGFHPIPTR